MKSKKTVILLCRKCKKHTDQEVSALQTKPGIYEGVLLKCVCCKNERQLKKASRTLREDQ